MIFMQKIELGYTQKLNLLDDKSINRAVEHLKVIRTTSQMSALVNDSQVANPKYPIQWSDWSIVLEKTLRWMLMKPTTRIPMVAIGIALVCRTKSPSFDAWIKIWSNALRSCFNEQLPEKSNTNGRHALFSLLHLVLGTKQDISVKRAFSLVEKFYHDDITDQARLWMVGGSLNLPEWVKEVSSGWIPERLLNKSDNNSAKLEHFKFNNINEMTLESCYLDFANWDLVLDRIEKNLNNGKAIDAFTLYRLVDRINAERGWNKDSVISRDRQTIVVVLDEMGYYNGLMPGKVVLPSASQGVLQSASQGIYTGSAGLGYTSGIIKKSMALAKKSHNFSGFMGSLWMAQGQSVGVYKNWNTSVCPIAVNEAPKMLSIQKNTWWNKNSEDELWQSKSKLIYELNILAEGAGGNLWEKADSVKIDANASHRMEGSAAIMVDFSLYNERSKKKMFKYLFGNSNAEEIALWLELLSSSDQKFRSSIESELLSIGLSNGHRIKPPFEMFQVKELDINKDKLRSDSTQGKEIYTTPMENKCQVNENSASDCSVEIVKKKTVAL